MGYLVVMGQFFTERLIIQRVNDIKISDSIHFATTLRCFVYEHRYLVTNLFHKVFLVIQCISTRSYIIFWNTFQVRGISNFLYGNQINIITILSLMYYYLLVNKVLRKFIVKLTSYNIIYDIVNIVQTRIYISGRLREYIHIPHIHI